MVTQKDVIQYCDLATGGDKEATIELYASYDADGIVPRNSNIRPLTSRHYACIMWHTAVKLGWIE